MASLSGKVAMITGSSRGIGRAVAERLAGEGASIAVHYVQRADKARKVVEAIESAGGRAFAVRADLGRVDDIRRMFGEVIDRFGRLDVVVNSAAVFHPAALTEVTESEFDADFAVNAKGAFFVLQEAARRIETGGRIIHISSGATQMNLPGVAVYAGSKGAGEQFAKTLAVEVAARNVTVNIVSPGYTETDMLPQDPEWRRIGAEGSAFGRLGKPEEIADVVSFLAGDQARWITGQNIQAGGGLVM